MTASELVTENRWWKGPEFLYNLKAGWPREDNTHSETENAMKEIVKNPATTRHVMTTSAQVRQTSVHQIIDANCYSSLKKLLRITAYVLQFARRSKEKRSLELNAEEIRSAEELWIKSIQNESFPEEVCHLILNRETAIPILVRQYDLYLDERGIVQCKGTVEQFTQPRRQNAHAVTLEASCRGFDYQRNSQAHVTKWSEYNVDHSKRSFLDNTRKANCQEGHMKIHQMQKSRRTTILATATTRVTRRASFRRPAFHTYNGGLLRTSIHDRERRKRGRNQGVCVPVYVCLD